MLAYFTNPKSIIKKNVSFSTIILNKLFIHKFFFNSLITDLNFHKTLKKNVMKSKR